MKHEELGIIKDIHVGLRDCNAVVCFFMVECLTGLSLQIVTTDKMKEMITDASIYKLEDLNNHPCIVDVDDPIVKFKKVKI